jgi:hypothetical protein
MNSIRTLASAAGALAALAASVTLPAQSSTRFLARLTASAVVPSIPPSTAYAVAVAYLHLPSNVLVYDVYAVGPTGSGQREPAPRVQRARRASIFALNGGGGAVVREARADPDARHVAAQRRAVHPGAHGVLARRRRRGQLLPNDPAALVADPSGRQMVPPNASPARATPASRSSRTTRIRYNVWAQKLAGPGTLSLTTSLGTSTLAGGPSSWSGFLPTTTSADLVALQNGTW